MQNKIVMNLDGKKVFFYCDNDKNIINTFCLTIKGQETENHIVEDGKNIFIGWGYYVFKEIDDEYQILAADYTKDPSRDLTEDLTLSLNILKDHLEISRRTGLSSDELITFQDTFVAKKIALSSDAVYLEKQQAVENGDSGWYMGDANDVEQSDDPDDYITLPLYKLLSYCPKAVSVLSLPVGTIAIIKDGEITNICDEDNKEVYAK